MSKKMLSQPPRFFTTLSQARKFYKEEAGVDVVDEDEFYLWMEDNTVIVEELED